MSALVLIRTALPGRSTAGSWQTSEGRFWITHLARSGGSPRELRERTGVSFGGWRILPNGVERAEEIAWLTENGFSGARFPTLAAAAGALALALGREGYRLDRSLTALAAEEVV